MKSRRSWWVIYGACAALVMGALLWITVVVIHLERSEVEARAEARHQEALRLALWRMDSWLAPRLAREAARPYYEYSSFYPQQRAYTRLLNEIEQGEVLTPSPLLSFQSDYFPLHYQVAPDGTLSSPQVPTGNLGEVAEVSYLSPQRIAANCGKLERISDLVTRETVVACVAAAESQPPAVALDQPVELTPGGIATIEDRIAQQARTRQEWSRRKGSYDQNIEAVGQAQQMADLRNPADQPAVSVGSLVPFWVGGAAGDGELMFARRVQVHDQQYYQGFLSDWPKLRGDLLEQISDLFPDARLVPIRQAPAPQPATETFLGGVGGVGAGVMLATIPVLLEVPPPVPAAVGAVSPVRSTLMLTWLAVVAALVAAAVTLGASISFGAKRSRFASAVTHELRTPLTTFRIYTEMLAGGMVKDREQRDVYLKTLEKESGRLATLVENVLAYSRLEEGRRPSHVERMTLSSILERLTPALERRAREEGMSWRIDCGASPETTLQTDVEAVGQILFNLVDNACKYAGDGEDPSIALRIAVEDGRLQMAVQDSGPGVPATRARSIFAPFDRGPNGASDKPGIGLGLALARGLARDLGGDLVLKTTSGGGACFELTLRL